MGGRTKTCWSLRLLVLFILLILTENTEVRDDAWADLRPGMADLHRLRGLTDRMFHQSLQDPASKMLGVKIAFRKTADQSLMDFQQDLQKCDGNFSSCFMKTRKEFNTFLGSIDEQKFQDRLISASEISYSYSQKLLIMTDNQKSTQDRAQNEYGMDPYSSKIVSKDCLNDPSCLPDADDYTVVKIFGRVSDDGQTLSGLSGSSLAELMLKPSLERAAVFSLEGNTTKNFQYTFIRIFMLRGVKAVLEINEDNHHVYQVMKETESVSLYKIPKRPADPSTCYDHQQIIIMQDDATVKMAATYLYEKHPQSSSIYILDSNQKPKLIHGDSFPLTEGSRLVLVGHGVRDSFGEMELAGFSAEEVSRIIKQTFRIGNEIKTISVVACEIGSDKRFVETLLKDLHETANIKTELHVRDALVQVRHTGEKITQVISSDGIHWQHKDDSTKVVATLDQKGNVVIRKESGNIGDPVFTNEKNILYINQRILRRFTIFRDSWPKDPQRFIDQNVFQESDQNALNELEALTWGFFHEDLPLPKKVDISNPEQIPEEYLIGKHEFDRDYKATIDWISDNNELEKILSNCYEVNSGEDVIRVIRHYAKSGENMPTYLMVKDWIYIVDPQSLYVYPIGKRLDNNQRIPIVKQKIMTLVEDQIGKERYGPMRKEILKNNPEFKSKSDYVEYVKGILSGDPTFKLPLETEAWCTLYFTASTICESARNFRTFPLTLMGLDIVDSKGETITLEELNFFFDFHPMARGQSWIDPSRRGFKGSATAEGSSKENNREPVSKGILQQDLKKVLKYEVKQYKLWSNLDEEDGVSSLMKISEKYKIIQRNTNKDKIIVKDYNTFKAEIAKMGEPQASGSLGGLSDGHTTSRDLISATNLENSFKLESHFSRLKSIFTQEIQNQLKARYGENLAEMHVREGSARMENGEFICELVSEGGQPEEFRAHLSPESERYNEETLSRIDTSITDLESHPSHQPSQSLEHTGTAVGVLGLMLGMRGAVTAFEQGDIKDGVVGSLQTAQGVTAMTTAVIARQALSAESRMAKAAATIMRSPAMKGTMAVIPLVGIGFGIYNIEEDLRRGGTQGYIDAGLDITMMALDVIEFAQPELLPIIAPLNMALSVIRLVVDDIYTSIEDELKSLPKDAGILDKLVAALRGFGKGLEHFAIHVASFFYDWHYEEIEQGHKLVAQISDYHKYYQVIKQEDGTTAIDFTSGDASWNGGGIQFWLSETGQSELCMDYFVSSDEKMSKKCWNIDTQGSQDIILGLGESHGLEYKTYKKKVLVFIPAGTVTVVSGYKTISNSRYGMYKGNSHSNRFFAIQEAEDQHLMEVMLSYYYTLYGEPGDDIFFLGPQRSYVQGAGGKDTYIIPKNGGKTIINNYDDSKALDTLHFSVDYSQISLSKSGSDVVLMYEGSHTVTIQSWFSGEVYCHMNMMSGDGVLFEISPTVFNSVQLVAKGINKGLMTQGETVDTTQPLLKTVTTIFGSRYDDVLMGNEEKNLMDGGGGRDHLIGGEGGDMYMVKSRPQSSVWIENYSTDQEIDIVIIEANLHTFNARVEDDNLILSAVQDYTPIDVTLVRWFRSPADRHLQVVTKDLITFKISDQKPDCQLTDPFTKCIKSLRLDYSNSASPLIVDLEKDEALSSVTEVCGSEFDDSISGNKDHNVIYPGRGRDIIQGRGGEDWYVITPGQGVTTINNLSPDLKMDFLFLKEKYRHITFTCVGHGIAISVEGTVNVHLENWFVSNKYQHLQIKTSDGVTAGLITDSNNCSSLVAFPLIVDNRDQEPEPLSSNIHPSLEEKVWILGDMCFMESGEIFSCTGTSIEYKVASILRPPWHRHPHKSVWILRDKMYVRKLGEMVSCIRNDDDKTPETERLALPEIQLLHQSVWIIGYKTCLIESGKLVSCMEMFDDDFFGKNDPLHIPPFYSPPKKSTWIIGDNMCVINSCEIFCSSSSHLIGQIFTRIPDKDKEECFSYRNNNSEGRVFCHYKGKVMVGESIREMYGSSGFDIMVGNRKQNLLDPYTGGALMFGGEGKDMYIIKHGYGSEVMIDNFAHDMITDTVMIDMNFLSGSQIKLVTSLHDLEVIFITNGRELYARLLNYIRDEQHQHLEFLSSDGVNFKVKPLHITGTVFEIEALKVTLTPSNSDCRLDLNSQKNLSTVHTLQGCPLHANNIQGNAEDNVLVGGLKNDALEGDEGDDTLIGGEGDDLLVGGFGDDTLYGEDGNDTMMGNSGDDVFIPGPGADLIDGGPGRDIVVYRGDPDTGKGVYVNLLTGSGLYADAEGDVLKDVETVIGSIHSDILVSGYESTLLLGSDGDDTLVSTGGDYLIGGEGHDIYMLAFSNGSVYINNCAKDYAADILYLNLWSRPKFEKRLFSDRLLLMVSEDNYTLNIELEGWNGDEDKCGHLNVVTREGDKHTVGELVTQSAKDELDRSHWPVKCLEDYPIYFHHRIPHQCTIPEM